MTAHLPSAYSPATALWHWCSARFRWPPCHVAGPARRRTGAVGSRCLQSPGSSCARTGTLAGASCPLQPPQELSCSLPLWGETWACLDGMGERVCSQDPRVWLPKGLCAGEEHAKGTCWGKSQGTGSTRQSPGGRASVGPGHAYSQGAALCLVGFLQVHFGGRVICAQPRK